MLGFPLLYFKGMRLLMFQLSGFYYKSLLTTGKRRNSSRTLKSCKMVAQLRSFIDMRVGISPRH